MNMKSRGKRKGTFQGTASLSNRTCCLDRVYYVVVLYDGDSHVNIALTSKEGCKSYLFLDKRDNDAIIRSETDRFKFCLYSRDWSCAVMSMVSLH